MDEAAILYTTWPDAETAEAAAHGAVEAGLAACANVFAPHLAIYRWEGRIAAERETAVLFKTGEAAVQALGAWIAARHPYALPAILALPAGAGSSAAYLAWLAAATAAPHTPATSGEAAGTAP